MRLSLSLLLFPLVLGCTAGADGRDGRDGQDGRDGADGEDGSAATSTIFDSAEEEPGENCPYGGTALSYGIDSNGNGLLDDNEIEEVIYVCNPTGSDNSGDSSTDYWGEDSPNPTTYQGSVTFTNFGDIFSFCENYIAIDGSLTIDSTVLVHLDDMYCLEAVRDDVQISSNSRLTSLNLSGLKEIGGSLKVFDNNILESIEFDSILYLNDELHIRQNSSLESVSASNLLFVGFDFQTAGEMRIENNAMLNSLEMPSLLRIQDYLTISNTALTDLSGLSALETTGENFNLHSNPDLTSVSGLEALERVGHQLQIYSNAKLTDTNGLSDLDFVGSNLSIYDNGALTDITLDSLSYTGSEVYVGRNPALLAVNLPAFEHTYGTLKIDGNTSLQEFNASTLQHIGYRLTIQHNPALTGLDFSSLETVVSNFDFFENDAFIDLELPSLVSLGFGKRTWRVYQNDLLETVSFPALEETSHIRVYSNPKLTSLSTPSLTSLYLWHSVSVYDQNAQYYGGDNYFLSRIYSNNSAMTYSTDVCALAGLSSAPCHWSN